MAGQPARIFRAHERADRQLEPTNLAIYPIMVSRDHDTEAGCRWI